MRALGVTALVVVAVPRSGFPEAAAGGGKTVENAPAALPVQWRATKDILEGMVRIPTGIFTRGSDTGPEDQQPARQIQLPNYYIDRTEVSAAAFAECVRVGACESARAYPETGAADLPAVGVSWQQAHDYCLWAGKRLPTEAEWEKAARSSTAWAYPWGETLDADHANFADGSSFETRGEKDKYRALAPVDSFPDGASSYGVINLSGNAAEWVLDWYSPSYYKRAPKRSPAGPLRGRQKVVRGGSFNDPAMEDMKSALAATSRLALDPHTAREWIGFRCAWLPETDLTIEGDPEEP